MSSFFIWIPSIDPQVTNVFDFFVTRGADNQFGDGTREFASAALRALSVDGHIERWSTQPLRSKYFSEYLGEEDWRDNWQIAWRMQVQLSEPILKPRWATVSPIGIDAGDESWEPEKRITDSSVVSCAIIADFKKAVNRTKAETDVSAFCTSERQRVHQVGPPEFRHARARGNCEQLRIDLGRFSGSFFAGGAEYAEQVIAICKKHSGAINFLEPLR